MTQSTHLTPARPATSDSIAQALSMAIHEHKIAPGTKLGEDELADIYGVSRTVVRAALQTLSHVKLIDIKRNKGASVASPSVTEANEVFEARALLEPRTARSAATRATPSDIDLLKRHIRDEHAALDAADPGRALYLSGLFHTEIARIADQATIAGMIETLVARSSLIIALYWRRESALCEKHAHHALVQALADRNEQQAEELMRSHLVDLHSALDLRDRNDRGMSLKGRLVIMTLRAMSLDELRIVLNWAAAEGWNPGLEDAQAFYAADPAGFLIKEVDGEPVAAVSVVNHDPKFAFLGLYLCKPAFRGQGHGIDVWRAGIAHAGSRSIGLDGVPDQQENYARSGFVKHGITVRYQGHVGSNPDPRVSFASAAETDALVLHDMLAAGIQRRAFSTAWFTPSEARQTMVLNDGSDIKGFATFRRCGTGTKIGPLYASTEADAHALLMSNPFAMPDQPVFIDVQGEQSALAMFLKELDFEPVFETARMFSGSAPDAAPAPFHAIATMELG